MISFILLSCSLKVPADSAVVSEDPLAGVLEHQLLGLQHVVTLATESHTSESHLDFFSLFCKVELVEFLACLYYNYNTLIIVEFKQGRIIYTFLNISLQPFTSHP